MIFLNLPRPLRRCRATSPIFSWAAEKMGEGGEGVKKAPRQGTLLSQSPRGAWVDCPCLLGGLQNGDFERATGCIHGHYIAGMMVQQGLPKR